MGNKSKLASKIIPYFPKHDIYIELFFGAGGIFFNKPRAKHNFLNDLDGDVYNLFMVVKNKPQELIEAVEIMPMHSDLFQYWRKNEEEKDVWKAARFLMLSNISLLGKGDTIRLTNTDGDFKKSICESVRNLLKSLDGYCRFTNFDFRECFNKIQLRDCINSTFIYADPPYLQTSDNYSASFTETDTADLFRILVESKIKFAISEFPHPFVLEQAENTV